MGRALKSLVGEKFGALTVIAFDRQMNDRTTVWRARCECGGIVLVRAKSLREGRCISCGCVSRREAAERGLIPTPRYEPQPAPKTDAEVPHFRKPEYKVWTSMKYRCAEKGGHTRYYGRGISVCKEWQDSFDAFYRHMGPRPTEKHQIDRINNDGNYEPGNCRWVTATENANNKSAGWQMKYELLGSMYTIGQLAKIAGISEDILRKRISERGWSVERACATPPVHRPRRRDVRPLDTDLYNAYRADINRGGFRKRGSCK